MSNFLLITNPSPAHMFPMYPIASELVKSGHTVKWISGWAFKEKVEETGAEYIAMHPKYDREILTCMNFFLN